MRFHAFFDRLNHHLAAAVVGSLAPSNPALRRHLIDRFRKELGSNEGLLSDPVFEATFGFTAAPEPLAAYSPDLLHPALVKALDAPGAERFPADRHPFQHQAEAWRTLLNPAPDGDGWQSALIASGTGSGKTECFLVPILNDLVSLSNGGTKHLTGVRAILIYPLNALIASQEERLTAWARPFGNRVRFSLFNGNTQEKVEAHVARETPWMVADRTTLRADPPPMLVTNTTMLEYMLVRPKDRPILDQSKGTLRWIVLDEAHTYIGSQAAEMALLLRRVRAAFKVRPQDVRLVATSATVNEDKLPELQVFLADMAGISPDRVHVIRGHREVPPLPDLPLDPDMPDLAHAALLSAADRYAYFVRNGPVRRIRQELAANARTVSKLVDSLQNESNVTTTAAEVVRVIDAVHPTCSTADNTPLLPVRGHIFIRSAPGLWACLNPDCAGRDAHLADQSETGGWRFGKTFDHKRVRCDVCTSLVYPVVLCPTCGLEYVLARKEAAGGGRHYIPQDVRLEEVLDDTAASVERDVDDGDDASGVSAAADEETSLVRPTIGRAGKNDHCLMTPRKGAVGSHVTLGLYEGDEDPRCGGREIQIVMFAGDGEKVRAAKCVRCGESSSQVGYNAIMRSRTFMLRVALPLALDNTKPVPEEQRRSSPTPLPLDGRRLITFTDSRQGSARFATLLDTEGERRFVHSFLFHTLWGRPGLGADPRRAELEAQIAQFEGLRSRLPPDTHQVLEAQIRPLRESLERLPERLPRMTWAEAVKALESTPMLVNLLQAWRGKASGFGDNHELAEFLLLREFCQTSRNASTLETMGLMRLEFPALSRAVAPDSFRQIWERKNGERPVPDANPDEAWQNLLHVAVDRWIRARTAVRVPANFVPWLGGRFSQRWLIDADDRSPLTNRQLRLFDPEKPNENRGFSVLAARYLGLQGKDGSNQRELVEILRAVWRDLVQHILTKEDEGYVLHLARDTVELVALDQVWHCPVILRGLTRTVGGLTPYMTRALGLEEVVCTPIKGLRFERQHVFPTNDTGRERIYEWLHASPEVQAMRAAGIWTETCDRVATWSGYYTAAEHSAQIDASQLRRVEKSFRAGKINVLGCSTTMEMGVDIGGLSIVAMNNAPPGPANFLQRAGRAGRRGETAALTVTTCRPMPHDEAIFRHPTWPFVTPVPIPYVALDSEPIARRHVNAMLLGRFFGTSFGNLTRFNCGAFFASVDETTSAVVPGLVGAFVDWLRDMNPVPADLANDLTNLVYGTAIADFSLIEVVEAAAVHIEAIAALWCAEHNTLLEQLTTFEEATMTRGVAKDEPAISSLRNGLRRLEQEFLLKELTGRGWLPGHGFPVDVLPFVHETRADVKVKKEANASVKSARRDSGRTFRDWPSRPLAQALMEYAPGNPVVIDGRVFKSEGITLNWRLPPSIDGEYREIQSLRWLQHCKRCNFLADASTLSGARVCPVCSSPDLEQRRYLRPPGFAVSYNAKPHNDLSVKPESYPDDPLVAATDATWSSVHNGVQVRASRDGLIFFHNRGHSGAGFEICLRCGAAASAMPSRDGGDDKRPPKSALFNHYPLRGQISHKQAAGGLCKGNDESYAVLQSVDLGGAARTDVAEFLFQPPNQQGLNVAEATGLAIAMREALARILGIERRELGYSVARQGPNQAIALYDTAPGGAGYASLGPRHLNEIMRIATAVLMCEADCDKACHSCLLTFDTDRDTANLDRHVSLAALMRVLGVEIPASLATTS